MTAIDPNRRWGEDGKPDYAGLLSFGGSPYTESVEDLAEADVAIVGAPVDELVSSRPGARLSEGAGSGGADLLAGSGRRQRRCGDYWAHSTGTNVDSPALWVGESTFVTATARGAQLCFHAEKNADWGSGSGWAGGKGS